MLTLFKFNLEDQNLIRSNRERDFFPAFPITLNPSHQNELHIGFSMNSSRSKEREKKRAST